MMFVKCRITIYFHIIHCYKSFLFHTSNWIPTTGPKKPANRDDSSDSEVETLVDKQGEISVSRILKNRPSLTIKAVGGGDDDWPCPLCPEAHGATFMSHESLVEHLKVHDGDDEEQPR